MSYTIKNHKKIALTYEQDLVRKKCIEDISFLKLSLINIGIDLQNGIIEMADAIRKESTIASKITNQKIRAVKKIHVKSDGTPRKISYLENQRLWRTKLPDGTSVTGKTEDIVYEKLFSIYGLTDESTIFSDVFEKALEDKEKNDNINENTIEHLRSEYNRFFVRFSNTMPKKDIRALTFSDIKEYTCLYVNSIHPTLSVFKAYKGILNLIFDYAVTNGLCKDNFARRIKNNNYYKSLSVSKRSDEKIFSVEEIETIKTEVRKRMAYKKKYNGYFINGYAILLSIETGMRVAEICALKWSDISEKDIWIHAQQLWSKTKSWEYCPRLKHERLLTPDQYQGRHFPLTNNIKALLDELKELQAEKHIHSDYVFCHEDGDWIKTKAYETCLRRLCQHLGFNVTNNHAFRMSLNSNVFIPKGIIVTERAKLLGHSVETNLKYYSFAPKQDIDDICSILNS